MTISFRQAISNMLQTDNPDRSAPHIGKCHSPLVLIFIGADEISHTRSQALLQPVCSLSTLDCYFADDQVQHPRIRKAITVWTVHSFQPDRMRLPFWLQNLPSHVVHPGLAFQSHSFLRLSLS